MSYDFTIPGGESRRFPVGGKYCPDDIVVTAQGGGVELPELESPGSAEDLMEGKQLIGPTGDPVTGTFTLDDELAEQAELINQIKTVLAGKTVGNSGKPEQEKNIEITTNGTYEIAPDDGYALSRVVATVDVAGGDPDLPPGYHEADYIQFTGTQFVDTGIIGNQDTRIRVAFAWNNSIQRHIFGCVSADNTASITSYMNGSWRFGAKSATKTVAKNNPDMLYIGEASRTRIAITGSSTAISDVADFETVGTLLLGGARDSDGSLPSVGINGKVAESRIWSAGELVLHLVPVTDGTVFRFWDIVGRKFHDSITDTPLGGGYW